MRRGISYLSLLARIPIRNLLTGAIAGSFLMAGTAASASTITFLGQDSGAPITGPFPNSAVAAANFAAATLIYGTTNILTFETVAQGVYTPIAAAPGVSIALTGPVDCSAALCGVSKVGLGSNVYAFNTTSGGSAFLARSAGTATFTFATPTNSFGVWLTALQTLYTSFGDMTVTFNDGSPQTLIVPANVNGGAQFFGFTSTVALSSVTLTNLTNDAWGIDDVTYNDGAGAPGPAPVPEPASLVLLGTGLVAVARRVQSVIRRSASARHPN